MNCALWVSVTGVGLLLGACGGYSSLGELAGNGGEGNGANATGGTGMGATGGTGMNATGGTGMNAAGGGMNATGGTGVGGDMQSTGGGMNATGGTGVGGDMQSTGGTGMGATGGDMQSTGGTGMGATGGTGEPERCMVPDDCPMPPPFCTMCPDGSSPCIAATCEMGVCGFSMPACDAPLPVACMTNAECEVANDTIACDPDHPWATGACIEGTCILVCPLWRGCETNADCASPSMSPCVTGSAMCSEGECVGAAGPCDGG